ncbi:MAG: hypothetical protein DSY47_01235 [Hydrogenothermus sp.]|nr:MAG: hypothetical protein DSY47_01235 [Hydrogenothermus sp.]
MKEANLAYIASLIDNSSYVFFRKDPRSKNSIYPFIKISVCCEEVADMLVSSYGGSKRKLKKKVNITISHRKLLKLIKDTYPYLIAKKELADIIISFYEIRFTRNYEAKRKKELIRKALEIQPITEKVLKTGNSSIKKWLEED